jgi:DNA-binding beta-propeller fold protein YncE
VVVDADGSVLVTDSGNHRIQRFDRDGRLLGQWGEQGSDDGQFNRPGGIALGPRGVVYITDGDLRLQAFRAAAAP